MWMLFLPMTLLLALVPFLLLSQDIDNEQNEISAAHAARMMQVQHEAALKFCQSTNTCKAGNKIINSNQFTAYLAPTFREGSMWASSPYTTYVQNGQIATIQPSKTKSLKRDISSGSINSYWNKKGIINAGLYNKTAKNFINAQGTVIAVEISGMQNAILDRDPIVHTKLL